MTSWVARSGKPILGWTRTGEGGEMDPGVKTRVKEVLKVLCVKGKQTRVGPGYQVSPWRLPGPNGRLGTGAGELSLRRHILMANLIHLGMIPLRLVPTSAQ